MTRRQKLELTWIGKENRPKVMCSAFRGKPDKYPNLTIKKIPKTVLSRCEWGMMTTVSRLRTYQRRHQSRGSKVWSLGNRSFPRKRESSAVMPHKQPALYVPASKRNGTLYIGVTSDLRKRVWEHKNDLVEGFTKRYRIHRIVYYELHQDMVSASEREKQMKSGSVLGSWS